MNNLPLNLQNIKSNQYFIFSEIWCFRVLVAKITFLYWTHYFFL